MILVEAQKQQQIATPRSILGKVVASANPRFQHKLAGMSPAGNPWFTAACRCQFGDDYVVDEVKPSGPRGGHHSLVHATGIREGGKRDGQLPGHWMAMMDLDPLPSSLRIPLP